MRRPLLETGSGSRTEAFGVREWGLLAGVALIWGSSYLFIDVGLEALAPGVIAVTRVVLGLAALALVPAARRPIGREDLARVAFLGVIWTGLPMILFPVAQQWIDSSVAGMLNGAVPLAGAAWAVVLLRRPLPRLHAVGLLIGFAGVLAISWPQLQGSRATTLGAALVILAVVLYGLAVNLAVPLQQRHGALPVLLRAQVAALVLLLPFGVWGLRDSSFAWPSVLAMVPLGVLGTGVAFVLMTTLVGRVGGPRGAVATYFIPVVAIVLGVLLLGERVAPAALAGTALVVGGAWLTSRRL
ncbi:MAG TPA: DMT family transporter [Actinomycetota bacterium]|jgi:drug/metabolite transporter (DMT)-like permease|nr:DMT family transporter [Actinomycetota bacterium]